MPAALRINPLEAHYVHTDPISLTAKCPNSFDNASENGALASCVFSSPERERQTDRQRWINSIYYMKLTVHCIFVLSVASDV